MFLHLIEGRIVHDIPLRDKTCCDDMDTDEILKTHDHQPEASYSECKRGNACVFLNEIEDLTVSSAKVVEANEEKAST
jgi:hypothetical protein